MKAFLKLSFFFIVLSIIFSCNKLDDLSNAGPQNSDQEFAIPLFSGKTNITEALDHFGTKDYIKIGTDGLITLNFKGDLSTKKANEIWTLFETIPFALNDSIFALPLSDNTNLDVEKIFYKSGYMSALVQSMATEDVTVKLYVPQLKKNGVQFEQTLNLKYSGILPVLGKIDSASIAGYELSSDNDTVYIKQETYTASGKKINATIYGALTKLEFSYVQGFWGREFVDLQRDTINIDLFENWRQGTVTFVDPTIKINVINSFGVPTRSDIKTMKVFTVKNDILDVQSQVITDGINFNYPKISEVGQTKLTSFSFDNKNSNIVQLLGSGPKALDYDIDFIANPDNNINIKGFMTDSSYFLFQTEVTLPFYGKAIQFDARDTFDLDFSKFTENAASAELKLITENGIPLGADVQCYFLDSQSNVIDSLFTVKKQIVSPAPVDELTGFPKPNVLTKVVTYIPLDAARIAKLINTKKIATKALFTTSNDGLIAVKIAANQDIYIRMGMKVKPKS